MDDNSSTPDRNPITSDAITPKLTPEDFVMQDTQREVRPSIVFHDSDQPLWTGWDVLALAVLTLAAMFVMSLVGFGIATHIKIFHAVPVSDLGRDPRLVIPVQVAAYLLVFVCMLWTTGRYRAGSFWRVIHWDWPSAKAYVPFLGGIALAVAIQVISALLPIPKQLPIEKYFKNASGAYLMAIFGITLAPLMEELFFRGFLYPVLARRTGVTLGIVMTSILFAFIHQSQLGYAWAPLLLLFIVGLVLTGVRARTGSVARSFLIHVGYNTTLFSLLWLQTDRFHHMEKAAAAIFTLKL